MTLRETFAEAYEHCVEATRRCTQTCIVDYSLQHHPEVFWKDSTRAQRKTWLLEAKKFMRSLEPTVSEEDVTSTNQLDLPLGILPGMRPPRTLIVESAERGYEHVCYDAATWEDLESAVELRNRNIDRAIACREDLLRKKDALRPYMEGHPERTVGEACELMRKDLS